jgi:hypothetical protein
VEWRRRVQVFEKDREIGWVEGYVKFVVDEVLYLLFLPWLAVTKQLYQ